MQKDHFFVFLLLVLMPLSGCLNDKESEEGQYFKPENRNELQEAVLQYTSDPAGANSTYGEINTWDTSLITDMSRLFLYARSFNGNITDWDVSSVTDMGEMFHNAVNLNQSISGWDVSSVTDMSEMFEQAYSFNQNISGWDVSNVTDTIKMFDETEELSDSNKCAIHTSFSSNNNWSYDWESYCSD